MPNVIPKAVQQFFDSSGNALANGKLYCYEAGTTTPLNTFTDATGGTPNANPVILDSKGQAEIWIDIETGYKFTLKDSSDNEIWTYDNVFYLSNGIVGKQQFVKKSVGTTQLADTSVTTAKVSLSAITSKLLTDGAVTTVKFASSAVTINKLQSDIDLSTLDNSTVAGFFNVSDLSDQQVGFIPQLPWASPSMPAQPGTLPASAANDVKWSPDGRFLAVAHNTTPYITIYERSGSILTKLADPSTLPAGSAQAVAWSPNGNFLSVAVTTTPYVAVYHRQGSTFTKLSVSAAHFKGHACAFSPNGQYLAVQCSNVSPGGPVINFYQIQGTTFNAFASTVSGDSCLAWSPDSQFVATSDDRGSIKIIQVTGVTTSTVDSPPSAIFANCIAWSPDGQFFVSGTGSSPYLQFWQYFKGTFSELTAPSDMPTAEVTGVSWSKDSLHLAVSFTASPYVYIYKRRGTTFTKLADPATLVGSSPNAISFSPNKNYLSLGVSSTPYLNTYETTGSFPSRMTLFGRNSINV